MHKIFLAHSFADRDAALVENVKALIESHGLTPVTGRSVGGRRLDSAVKKLIDGSDALVALFTLRQGESSPTASHPWVHEEFGHARSASTKRAIAIYEESVAHHVSDGGNEYIPLEWMNQIPALLALGKTIGGWKHESGRLVKFMVKPDKIAEQLRFIVDRVICEVRCSAANKEQNSDWVHATIRREEDGVFIYIRMPEDVDMVQIRMMGPLSLESDYTRISTPVTFETGDRSFRDEPIR